MGLNETDLRFHSERFSPPTHSDNQPTNTLSPLIRRKENNSTEDGLEEPNI